ncbi:hypothetical protein PR048_032257 [Dryococelus australis]|uniref:Uncharacterized protein n=1 Tax=Dryococelus australis TaxID=614101 RepID=A0ABQ9G5U6_9NEOP|nr:hypothetical protein PR048_032257 [Dryococelus australis]
MKSVVYATLVKDTDDLEQRINNAYAAVRHNPAIFERLRQSMEVSWQKVQAAGEEKAGDVDDDGIPVIAVITTCACSRRSYVTNHNVLSGLREESGLSGSGQLRAGFAFLRSQPAIQPSPVKPDGEFFYR